MPKDAAKNTEVTPEEKKALTEPSTGFVPKVKRCLTLPLIKPKIDKPYYVMFNEPVKIGKKVDKQKDAAIIATVTDLETSEIKQLLVPAVLQGILHDDYGAPKFGTKGKGEPMQELEPRLEGQEPDAYVGRCFAITQHAKQTGKQYHPHTVLEIEKPE
jgi:hypothetical protein